MNSSLYGTKTSLISIYPGDIKKVIAPILHYWYCHYYGLSQDPPQSHRCTEKCNMRKLSIFTFNNEIFVHDYNMKEDGTYTWRIRIPTEYLLGDHQLDHVYVCVKTGLIHVCGRECNRSRLNEEQSYTCELTFMVTKEAELDNGWEFDEKKPMKVWKSKNALTEMNHSLPRKTIIVMDKGKPVKEEIIDPCIFKISTSTRILECSYSELLYRYKNIFYVLFFGEKRKELDYAKRMANNEEKKNKTREYINKMKKKNKPIIYLGIRRRCISIDKKTFQFGTMKNNHIDAFVTKYVQIILRIIILIYTHSMYVYQKESKFYPDYVFISILSWMRAAGLKVNNTVIIQRDPWIADFMIPVGWFKFFNFSQRSKTDATNAILKALQEFKVPLDQLTWTNTYYDAEEWKNIAQALQMRRSRKILKSNANGEPLEEQEEQEEYAECLDDE